ncbi:MAG TPA: hypothetical protein VMB03_17750, partial [Bryobacteraceae bacterium]|nr:hypothetical protein [Bryobacteraceae bacterium]
QTHYQGIPELNYLSAPDTNCYYAGSTANVYEDFSGGTFPASVGPVDNIGSGNGYPPGLSTAGTGISTTSGYYTVSSRSMQNPKMGRYAAFNAADNMATLIREDTTLKPMLFVIGLSYSNQATEPLDSDWLARVANDPTYQTTGTDSDAMNGTGITPGHSVYQTGQTAGLYCLATNTTSSLNGCFSQVTNALLRLTL